MSLPPAVDGNVVQMQPNSRENLEAASQGTSSERRCIITNDSIPSKGIVAHQVVPTGTEFSRLRVRWHLPRGPYNTVLEGIGGNTIYLRADWAITFKEGCWALIPDDDVLLEITRKLISMKTREKNANPRKVIHRDAYSYTFVALDLEGVKISRTNGPSSPSTIYDSPYDTFPKLSLPLHPYLAIHHALAAFNKYDDFLTSEEDIQLHNSLQRISTLWDQTSNPFT
ncbi:unnamed protein product [Somion occarium]|uniref:Uncharacterized protein n=1 Tax=Somion occarium TaxID=3059160 RepID=A0ABP1E270_9APHY